MKYIIDHFLKPWGIVANGYIRWHGEERGDIGTIVVGNNEVTARSGVLLNDDSKTVEKTYTVNEVFALLSAVEGHVSVSGGVLSFADGQVVDLKKVQDD
jgi:hypothetical protein